MKKIIIKIFIIAICLTGINSCADLDLPSDGRLTLEDMFSSYYGQGIILILPAPISLK